MGANGCDGMQMICLLDAHCNIVPNECLELIASVDGVVCSTLIVSHSSREDDQLLRDIASGKMETMAFANRNRNADAELFMKTKNFVGQTQDILRIPVPTNIYFAVAVSGAVSSLLTFLLVYFCMNQDYSNAAY